MILVLVLFLYGLAIIVFCVSLLIAAFSWLTLKTKKNHKQTLQRSFPRIGMERTPHQ